MHLLNSVSNLSINVPVRIIIIFFFFAIFFFWRSVPVGPPGSEHERRKTLTGLSLSLSLCCWTRVSHPGVMWRCGL